MDTDAPKKKEKRPPENHARQEQIGPRTPRMVGTITLARCSNCGAVLQSGFDANGRCPRCGFELHSCKQCMYFDTSARFECTQPIPERVAKKDARNECTFYAFRTTVEKDTAPTATAPVSAPSGNGHANRPNDARKAFDDLFKK
jgi:predicted RNA-binding Zn-ribbon protein involved in translation (DUF1610 family)